MHSVFEDLLREFRFGLRLLARNRAFTIIAVLTLALGIGATTAIFSVFYATVLAPLPYRDPDRLVMVQRVNEEGRFSGIPADTQETWREESQTLASLANFELIVARFTLTSGEGAERIQLEQVDYDSIEVLGVDPVLGRWFSEDEVIVQGNTAESIVISYGLWQRVFGGDPDVIGRSLPGWSTEWGRVIIGVMPPGFYTNPNRAAVDGWYLITPNPGRTFARLREGVTVGRARAELEVLGRPPVPPAGSQEEADTWHVQVSPLHEYYRGGGYAQSLYRILGAVGFVLLIAAVNVANLQLNRGVARDPEMATRAALGAGRWRMFRQLVVENIALVLMGGLLGLLVAWVGIRVFVMMAPNFYPPSTEITVNSPVLVFTLVLSVMTGILSGLIPGFRSSRPDVHDALKQGGRGAAGGARLGIRRALVVTEIALAMVLLVSAGLMINSYARLTRVDVGIDPDNVLRFEVLLNGMDRYRTRHSSFRYEVTPEVSNLYDSLLERIRTLPGVESVGMASSLPGASGFFPFRVIAGEDPQGDEPPFALYNEASADVFSTAGIPLVRGRTFDERDTENAPGVVIVNEAFQRQYLGNNDPIGQMIQVDMTQRNPELDNDRVREVVGVVGDVMLGLGQTSAPPTVYVPYRQNLTDYAGPGEFQVHAGQDFVVKTSRDPSGLAPAIRRVFADVDPNVAAEAMMPMREMLSAQAGNQEFWMRLLGIFALMGIFLAAIGVYGILAYTVEQRTHEFGIRAAFGARPADILRLVLREGMVVTAIGLVLGLAGTFAATRLVAGLLYGVSPMDPLTITGVAGVLLVVSLTACYLPGRRARRLDPLPALRVE